MLPKRIQLAAKIEGTEGTAETLAAANAIRVANCKFTPNVKMNPRPFHSTSLSPFSQVPGFRSGQLEFNVPLAGSGTAGTPPEFSALLRACGFAETIVPSTSVTYSPASTAIPSATLGAYEDNTVIKKIWGARGNVRLALATGNFSWLHFVFTGADFSVADGSLLVGTNLSTIVPQAFLNASFSLASYAALIGKLDIDAGNKLALRQDANPSSGHKSAVITERLPVMSFDPEKVAVGAHDFYGLLRAGTEGALTLTLGATAGNICAITAPKVQYTKIGEAERDGLRTLGIDCQLNRDSGDDEISIVFT